MKIFWFLCGNENTPSSRIHGIKVHEKLVSLGYSSHIVHKPHRYFEDLYFPVWLLRTISLFVSKNDMVVLQKVYGVRTQALVKLLKRKGTRIAFVDCDLPLKPEVAKLADVVICPSKELCNQYLQLGISNVYVIEDAPECFKEPTENYGQKKTILWFGKSGLGKWEGVSWFRNEVFPAVEDHWTFSTLSDHKDSTIKWNSSLAPSVINKADLVIIPVLKNEFDKVKSANRCTQSLALGVPVLCNVLPSYRSVIKNNYNGLISDVTQEWIEFIRKLESQEYLKTVKQNAFESAKLYAMDKIILKWISHLSLQTSTRDTTVLYWIDNLYTAFLSWRRYVAKLKRHAND